MINPQSQALVSFPVTVSLGPGVPSPSESVWLGFACRLLETKLLQLLRFQFGEARPCAAHPAPVFIFSEHACCTMQH